MNNHIDEFYAAAVKNAFPDSWDVRKPNIPGGVSPVFLCDTPQGTKVCRFSTRNIVARNRYVSHLLALHDISVPRTCAHAYLDTWFETYDYCPAPTLYERSEQGLTKEQLLDVYRQTVDIQYKISQIPTERFNPPQYKHMHNVFMATQMMRVSPGLAYIYGLVHKIFSDTGNIRLLHNDINNKNILVDDSNRPVKLIDLDSVALCNESFSVMLTLRTYPLVNHAEYMDYYEHTMERKINRRAIMTGLKILDAIRAPQTALNRLLWRGYGTPPGR